jgi:hypothetical protein
LPSHECGLVIIFLWELEFQVFVLVIVLKRVLPIIDDRKIVTSPKLLPYPGYASVFLNGRIVAMIPKVF